MPHRLILLYGSSPGAGKSTLSSRLRQALAAQELPVHWIYEDDVLHLDFFAPVMAYMRGEGAKEMTDACLAATAKLVEAYTHSDTIIITDSILPYYDWLFAAKYDVATVASFSQTLEEQLRPLRPLVVYLQADIATALHRAVAQRGAPWLEGSITFMNRWQANQAAPITNLAEVIAYWQQTDRWKVACLSAWAGEILWLDSALYTAEDCAEQLVSYLGLTPVDSQPVPQQADLYSSLAHYAGHYTLCGDEAPDDQRTLTIRQVDGALWVDLYWPNGCRLVPVNASTLQLEDTSHWLEAADPIHTPGARLHYHYRGKIYVYQKA